MGPSGDHFGANLGRFSKHFQAFSRSHSRLYAFAAVAPRFASFSLNFASSRRGLQDWLRDSAEKPREKPGERTRNAPMSREVISKHSGKISEAISAASKTRETLPAQSARRGRAAGERRPKERPKAARASKGVSDRIGLLFECSCSSCRSCLASPPGACSLALAVLAALASLAFLAVLAAVQPHALPVPR